MYGMQWPKPASKAEFGQIHKKLSPSYVFNPTNETVNIVVNAERQRDILHTQVL